jgi:hypothetical protein
MMIKATTVAHAYALVPAILPRLTGIRRVDDTMASHCFPIVRQLGLGRGKNL